jgi:hypothetical protein
VFGDGKPRPMSRNVKLAGEGLKARRDRALLLLLEQLGIPDIAALGVDRPMPADIHHFKQRCASGRARTLDRSAVDERSAVNPLKPRVYSGPPPDLAEPAVT